MSLNGAMNTAVSALKAQGQALAMVSDNLANSTTTGYKSVHARFSTLVTEMSSSSYYPSGGVRSTVRQNVDSQGLISASENNTDIAIDGNGMFVVKSGLDTQELLYTRAGEFDTDDDGYLVSNGNYLMGWVTDSAGNVSNPLETSLEAINVNLHSATASATSEMEFNANLPSTAAVGAVYTSTSEVIDSRGASHSMAVTYTKTATGWDVGFTAPTTPAGTTVTPATSSLTFDTHGALLTSSAASLTITWPTADKLDNNVIALDFGSVTELASEYDSGTIAQNGLESGELTGVSIGDDGSVVASYDNGQNLTIYKIALATFPNYDGLSAVNDTLYSRSPTSGTPGYYIAGTGGTGDISGNALESSNVDTSDEFTRMIVAQQAYSAASQIISTAQDMYDDLMAAVR